MKIVKYIFLSSGLFLLFFGTAIFGAANGDHSRSGTALWDLGHIFVWALGTHLMVNDFKLFSKKSVFIQFIFVTVIGLMAGVFTEVIQIFNGRHADVYDLLKDFVGILTGLFFFNKRKNLLLTSILRSFQVITLLLLINQVIPFIKAVTDETIARIQFPVLSAFETPFEKDRWITKGREEVSEEIVFEGRKAFKVSLRPEKYAGFSLDFFPSDWSEHQTLEMNLFYPAGDSLKLHVRIDDKHHRKSGQAYSDRFNGSRLLHPGWNQIHIKLKDIKRAPQTREMDMHNIKRLILFFIQPSDWLILYIDDIKLIK